MKPDRHPLADVAVRLIRENMPGVHRVEVTTFALLLGMGRHRGQRMRAWIKFAEDLLDDLAAEGVLDKVDCEGLTLYGLRWPDVDDADPSRPEPPPAGYAGPARTPIRAYLVEQGGPYEPRNGAHVSTP